MEVDGRLPWPSSMTRVGLAKKLGVELTPDGYSSMIPAPGQIFTGFTRRGTWRGGYKQIVIAAGKGSEAALAIFEDLDKSRTGEKKVEV